MGGGSTLFYGFKKRAATTFTYLFIDKAIGLFTCQGNVISQMRMMNPIQPVA